MAKSRLQEASSDDAALLGLIHAIASHDLAGATERLRDDGALASRCLQVGASRRDPSSYHLAAINHYMYAGDTALHIAAAAHAPTVVEALLSLGADPGARNRRGAEPLHYAADGADHEGSRRSAGPDQVTLALIAAGADPDARDRSGVTPLHRAVRNRNLPAVIALIDGGADPSVTNANGSTALHIAVRDTGKSGSGSDRARTAQSRIIRLLREHGASPTDVDGRGKTVVDAASSDRIRRFLEL